MKWVIWFALSCCFALALACGTSRTPGGTDGGGAADGGGTVDAGGGEYSACSMPSDCIVIPASCCGSCGAATRGDAIAIHRDRSSDYLTDTCGPKVGCAGCYMPQDPALVATCDAGQCVMVDLHEHPAAACAADMDCRLRTRDCCECGGDTSVEGLLAISIDGESEYFSLVCDPGTGCAECAPIYPMEAMAVCNPAGYCEAVWPGMGI